MVSLNGRQNGRAAAKGLFQGGLQIVEEHQRFMHIHHVNDPLLPLFQQLRTHKALALQSKSSLLGDSPPFCGKNGKAAVFLQGWVMTSASKSWAGSRMASPSWISLSLAWIPVM